MILKISQKVNAGGWCRQAVIDFDKKTVKAGTFLFRSGNVTKLTATQYAQFLTFCKDNNFLFVED